MAEQTSKHESDIMQQCLPQKEHNTRKGENEMNMVRPVADMCIGQNMNAERASHRVLFLKAHSDRIWKKQ